MSHHNMRRYCTRIVKIEMGPGEWATGQVTGGKQSEEGEDGEVLCG